MGMIAHPQSLAHALSELDLCPVFTTLHFCVCHKTQTRSAPMPSRVPAPRHHISGITQSIGFLRLRSGQALGHPSHQGIRLGRLLPSLREPLVGYSVPPACRQTGVPILRDRRSALYAVSLASSGYHVLATTWPNGDKFPFGPACQPFGRF